MPYDLMAAIGAHQTLWHNREAVTLTYVRTAGNTTDSVQALKRMVGSEDLMSFGSRKVYRQVTSFHVAVADVSTPPLIADTVTDASFGTWNIVEVDYSTLGTRYALRARRWVLGDTVSIHRSQVRQSGDGSEVVTWPAGSVVQNVEAGIQPDGSFTDDDLGRRIFNTKYRVILGASYGFSTGDKITDEDGNTYMVLSWELDERVDDLQVVICDRTP